MGYFFDIDEKEDFIMESCFVCGMRFAYPKVDYEIFRRTHDQFFCPKGHSQYYSAKTEKEKLKEQVDHLEKMCKAKSITINYMEKQFYGMKGYAAKLKKRISNNEK